MTTYIAWDGNEYPQPTPEGWYLATDDRWWPEGHGPGTKLVAPPAPGPPPPPGMPTAAPPPQAMAPPQSMAPPETIYSSPPPGSGGEGSTFAGTAPPSSSGNGKAILFVAVVLVGLVALGAGAFVALSSSDDDATEATATTVFQTQAGDVSEGSSTTTDDSEDNGSPATTAAVVDGRGSLDDPYAIGESFPISYEDFDSGEQRVWNIEVLESIRDITEAVAEENQFNDPPEEGSRFMGAPIRVTYASGPVPASLFELTFKAVGPSGVVLATFDPSCGVIPDELDTFAELFEGGAVEGNVCWSVPSGDIGQLTMIVEVFLDDVTVYADLDG